MNKYDMFLSGSAVVEIKRYNDDIIRFLELINDLGLYGAEYFAKVCEQDIFHLAQINDIKNVCVEYQIGKGFTFGDKEYYIKSEYEILSVEDLAIATRKQEDYISFDLVSINEELSVLDEFMCDYSWLTIKFNNGHYGIRDTELDQVSDYDDYETIEELISRIVGRAIDYFQDEQDWTGEEMLGYKYGMKLYNIAKKYKSNDKWENNWLKNFKNLLDEMIKEV